MTSPFKCDRPKDIKMVMLHVLCSQFTSTLILAQICVIECYVDHVEPEEQRDHDKVWEERSEPDNLPGGMETLKKFFMLNKPKLNLYSCLNIDNIEMLIFKDGTFQMIR